MEQLGERIQPDISEEAIVQKIRKHVEGERYLLVLDDVWDVDPHLWDDFYDSLVGISANNERSWCLITSRIQLTATIMGTHDQYQLGKLSDNDCWSILKDKVAGRGEVPEQLIAMKDAVIKRCAGLPLSAKVLGSLLHVQRKEEWPSIVNRKLSTSGDMVMQILKLSFDYLPSPYIKKCFAYLSIFREDEPMYEDELIKLWMAEGFLRPDPGSETTMEKLGHDYLQLLLQSSLLEKLGYYETYKCERYVLHDLVHDLAELISRNETRVFNDGQCRYGDRYLSVIAFENLSDKYLIDSSTSVRTVILRTWGGISDQILSKFRNLHVLKLGDNRIVDLPSSIAKLKHLRFLALSLDARKTSRESLCKLYCLQTLKISDRSGFEPLQVLPQGMSNLISLRHLDYNDWDWKFPMLMPVRMGQLTCLQTLKFFNIGKGKGRGIDELGCLEKLQGELSIRNLQLVKGKEGAMQAKMSKKQNLSHLEFCWIRYRRGLHKCDEFVLEGLEPHPNLGDLSIKRFMGERFSPWLENLSMLVRLVLEDCTSCIQLPMLGHLPYLEDIKFSGLQNLSCIGASFYSIPHKTGGSGKSFSVKTIFPALKILKFCRMKNLIEWKEAEVGSDEEVVDDGKFVFPVLETLEIYVCPQLITVPNHFPSVKNLRIIGTDHAVVARNILSRVTDELEVHISKMDGLTCLSDVISYTHEGCCPKLTLLKLTECHNLMRLQAFGTSLQILSLFKCDNLTELPRNLCELQCLQVFEMIMCSRVLEVVPSSRTTTLEKHPHFKSLKVFIIRDCDGLTTIEIPASCKSLECLDVYNCPNLMSFQLDLQQTPLLSLIWLYNCPKLLANSMPTGFGNLTKFSHLRIQSPGDDSSSDLFDWPGLISCSSTLRFLVLHGSPHMESELPNQLQHLTSLTFLGLEDFGMLETLPDWLGNLTSLERLQLKNCQKLQRLPLAPAMRRLDKLRVFIVCECPLLKESLRKKRGSDSERSKISHIPVIQFDQGPQYTRSLVSGLDYLRYMPML